MHSCMKTPESLIPKNSPALTRRDLVDFEPLIAREIASFLPFKASSLNFPKSFAKHAGSLSELKQGQAVYLAREKKVLLPLMAQGELIGVFVARGVALRAPKTLPAYLSRLASLCLEKLLLYKAGITDPETGLSRREPFLDTLSHEIELAQSCMPAGPESCLDAEGPGFCACLGVLLINIPEMEALTERHGRAFGNRVLAEAASVVRGLCPDKANSARFFDDSLALVRPGATSTQCRDLANRIAEEMSDLRVTDPVLEQDVPVGAAIGTADYPKDMDGPELFPRPHEQAWMLVKKAQRAARAAWERGPNTAFAFGRILSEGGRVLKTLPINRLMVNLGRDVRAQEGRMFSVRAVNKGEASALKGEIVLMRVFEHQSLAEILYQNDPARPILAGDHLTLIQEQESLAQKGEGPETPRKNALGLYAYRDFLERWTRESETRKTFTLALVRMPEHEEFAPGEAEKRKDKTEDRIREASAWAAEIFGEAAFGGRFGASGLIYFLPDVRGKKALGLARELYRRMAEGFEAVPAVGLAAYPYLTFSKSETLENCRKALDYALLLKPPRVGLLDSLALNISADRLFGQDRIFDAMEEYKLALLADRTNTMARNSLGVCLAGTDRLSQAKKHFKAVFTRDGSNLMAFYNYGCACERLKQTEKAEQAFTRCLTLDPGHVFSLIRLGRIAQDKGKFRKARNFFLRAAKNEQGFGLTRRYLARLALAQDKTQEAGEYLHQALVHDPRDAFSLNLLAELYLDQGEDPEVAEVLARQSAALMPEKSAFRKTLARALDAQNRTRDARAVLAGAAFLK